MVMHFALPQFTYHNHGFCTFGADFRYFELSTKYGLDIHEIGIVWQWAYCWNHCSAYCWCFGRVRGNRPWIVIGGMAALMMRYRLKLFRKFSLDSP